jgi:hypothetical protein
VPSANKYPPQNWSLLVKFSLTPSLLCHTQCLLMLDLKLCTPIMENSSQKNPIRKATLTNNGAAFFKLRRMTWQTVSKSSYAHSVHLTEVPLVRFKSRMILKQLSMSKTRITRVFSTPIRPRRKAIQKAMTARKSVRLNECRRYALCASRARCWSRRSPGPTSTWGQSLYCCASSKLVAQDHRTACWLS